MYVARRLYGHVWTVSGLFGLAFGGLLWLFITRTLADPDLWGHLRFGLDMLAAGAIRITESYSFTADRPWVNHEWLSELLMAAAYAVFGVAGLNLLKMAAIAIVAATIVAVSREAGGTATARNLLVGLAVLATYTRTQVIRPQMFAVPLFVVVLYLLGRAERGQTRALFGLPLCFALWANLHGSWIIGLAVVGVWLAFGLYEHRTWRASLTLVGVGIGTVAATLVNPYGWALWQFLFDTVRFERADITEWQPLLALPPLILAIEAVLPAVAVFALLQARERVPARHVTMLVVLWIGAFRIGRVDAFAQAATAVLLAPQIVRGIGAIGQKFSAPFWRMPVRLGVLPTVAAGVIALAGASQLRDIAVAGPWIPDYRAAMFIREHAADARVLTWFNWGEYAIWQLSPAGVRVSMDGRRETVYSAGVLTRHWEFYRGRENALDYPDEIGADHIWLPVDLPVVQSLRSRGWVVTFESPDSIVFARRSMEQSRPFAAVPPPASFPWP